MFAPLPDDPVFTEGVLRIVRADVPRRLVLLRELRTLFSTFVAVLVGGGGAIGGGAAAAAGALGVEGITHIIKFILSVIIYFRFASCIDV